MSGSPLFFTASAAALSFCAFVCASGACGIRKTTARRESSRQASLGMEPLSDRRGRLYGAVVATLNLLAGKLSQDMTGRHQTRMSFARAVLPVWLVTAVWDALCATALSVFAYGSTAAALW